VTVLDLRQLADDTEFTSDLCIVGGGPIGLAVALEFADTSTRVCIVESGSLERHAETEALGEFENVGLFRTSPDLVRCRGLGGTSSLWTGRCGVFDAIDFQSRPWLPYSGWPIQFSDVSPFFDRAGQLLGLGPAIYDNRASELLRQGSTEANWDSRLLLPVIWQFSRGEGDSLQVARASSSDQHLEALRHAGAPQAVDVGRASLPSLKQSRNITVLLNANATKIEIDGSGSRVQSVSIATLTGRAAKVKATNVVLACGGIDNARLLLVSKATSSDGWKNVSDTVGRFLTDHPLFEVVRYEGNGSRRLRRQFGHRWLDRGSTRYVYQKGVRLSPDLQRREGLLNCAVHMLEYGDQLAPISLAGRALRSLRKAEFGKDAISDASRALTRPHALAVGAYDRYVMRRPALQNTERVALNCVVEQRLDPESRITLSHERDALGVNKAKIDWRSSQLEFETVKRMTDVITSEITRMRYESPIVATWLQEDPTAFRSRVRDFAHPMCSTRMSSNATEGVVDENCKVHGISGLFVAGASTFSTAGYMNPTLLAVALSLRLADHLKGKVLASASDLSPKVSQSVRTAKVGIVGAGNRVKEIYLPIFEALQDEFEVVGFTSRSRERSQDFTAHTGFKWFDSPQALAAAKPDFLLVAVTGSSIEATVPGLVDLGLPLFLETPFCWSSRKGRATLKRITKGQTTVGIAEQTPFLPIEQFKRQLIELGLLGRVVAAKNDFAVYDYHGIAALRAYVGNDKKPKRVNAVEAALAQAESSGCEKWIQGSVTYADGTLLLHEYSNEYFDAPFRAPRSLRVYGTAGSITDDTVMFRRSDGSADLQQIRRERSNDRLSSIVVDTPVGVVRWENPFSQHTFSEEQIAVATLLRDMRIAVQSRGMPLYSAESALRDTEFLEAMRSSAARAGKPVYMPLRPLFESLRSLPAKILRKLARA
jgi:choline dehydrogenase-like flavoprotein/predicted dehydrogenase